jgi:hypothetical protein
MSADLMFWYWFILRIDEVPLAPHFSEVVAPQAVKTADG